MGKPIEEVKDKEYYKDIHFLYEILGTLKSVEEVKLFIKDIHTRSELRMFKRRWHIANLLLEGHDIRTVADKAKTSTQTVSRIKKVLEEGYGGLKLAIERVNEKAKKEEEQFLKSKSTKGGSKFVKGWLK
ncbi:MAG TPA: YerC/YecD family TrpR-related protein [Xanthomonadales bacterium]|nr:YerC/YecD family TrpR-related protein [Xanthomonadales bacterium]